jgi:hypothetical protein
MKSWIKTSLAVALASTVGLGATAALARGWGDCDGPRGGPHAMHQRMAPEQMSERMGERAEVRLARLELALALTPQQQSAWSAFKGAMTERAERMAAAMQKRLEAGQPKTALERIERMEEMSKLRQTEMAETRKTVESFYATLNDAQKTVFDAEFDRMGHDGRHGMGAGSGRGMGPGRG